MVREDVAFSVDGSVVIEYGTTFSSIVMLERGVGELQARTQDNRRSTHGTRDLSDIYALRFALDVDGAPEGFAELQRVILEKGAVGDLHPATLFEDSPALGFATTILPRVVLEEAVLNVHISASI